MATIGNTSISYQFFSQYGFNTNDVLAIQVTMPQAGQITGLHAYVSGHGGGINIVFCIWNTSGTMLARSNSIAIGAGSGGIAGQALQAGTLITPYTAAAGEVLRIGFWTGESPWEWTEQNGGTEYQAITHTTGTPPGSVSFVTLSGTPQIWGDYTPYTIPTVTSFTPGAGVAGTSVSISGSHFTGTSNVSFNGTSASYSVNTDSSITATAPVGGTNGPITVTNPAGTGSSSTDYVFSSIYADSGTDFQAVSFWGDNGSSWVAVQVWIDTGTSWVQVA